MSAQKQNNKRNGKANSSAGDVDVVTTACGKNNMNMREKHRKLYYASIGYPTTK